MKKEETSKQEFDYISFARESCLVAGFFMLGYGIWSIYPPAAWIVCGGLLLWVGFPQKQKGGD
ncbi:hypothetical protein AB4Z17_08555 [Paenibacillus sp. TAF43_2]|uniref:hypothetical protein n=1 Tax=Paenibacillus sp. TAF43_2 TaxID=3233069 RepID=UPI003F9A3EDB